MSQVPPENSIPNDPEEELFDPVEDLEAQMKASEPTPAAPAADAPAADAATTALQARMVEVLEKIVEQNEGGPIKQIPIGKAKIKTPWNPTGSKRRPKLRRITRMNGFRLGEMTLSDDEIRGLNQIKAGKYNNGRWVVIESDSNESGASVELFVQNKSQQDRLELAKICPKGLIDILAKILADQTQAA